MSDERPGESRMPASVVGAAALGIAPVPFLGIYALLFILRGTIFPVSPPDITSSRSGEALSGLVALGYGLAIVIGAYLFVSQRDRWVFVLGQLACLVICVEFILHPSSGEPGVPVLLGATSALALVCCLVGPSWAWVGGPTPRRIRWRRAATAPTPSASESVRLESPDDRSAEDLLEPVDPNPYG
jgi:hypothetical protein